MRKLFSLLGPGILVAATGVGAGDLLTASLGGASVGLVILWAAPLGAILKWYLNEGIARWQMATGMTILEGWVSYLGRWIRWIFVVYLLGWSFLTGGALMTACGVAGTALLPLSHNPVLSKIFMGVIHSFLGFFIVLKGGFRLFERLMAACVGIMFFTVVSTALCTSPDWSAVLRGLACPTLPPQGIAWIIGILGGVGGTVTLLSYGYWIREKHRTGRAGLKVCRIDLGAGYVMTALFGVSMVIIGSQIRIQGSGIHIVPQLAEQLELVVGPSGRWIFFAGFWGAVFSSLLGVWQSVPYLFADLVTMRRTHDGGFTPDIELGATRWYRGYLGALAVVPLPMLLFSVKQVQLAYAVFGAFFMPLLALTLLILNNRRAIVGHSFRNGWVTNAALVLTLIFFACVGISQALEKVRLLMGR